MKNLSNICSTGCTFEIHWINKRSGKNIGIMMAIIPWKMWRERGKIVGCLFFCILHDQKWEHILKRALVRAKGRKIIQTEVYAARIQNVECPSTGNIRAQSIRAEARATQMHTTNRRDGRTTKRISNWIRSFRLFRKFRRRPFNLPYFFIFIIFFSLLFFSLV